MLHKKLLIFIFLSFFLTSGVAQIVCTGLGQNPGTAFPVCGTDTFSIESVNICGDRQVPGPCTAVPLTDKNPYWYKFTCFTAGTLGFLITPKTITDDYDWQIFDITNHNPSDVYTDASLFLSCNWSGEGGLTGASNAGTQLARCDGLGVPKFSSMPTLIQGHEYLLLISHFSDSQSGYSLSFGGGTGNITDPVNPALLKARAACDGSKVSVKLNKKMKCSSLAADGSDFTITPAIAAITNATGVGCNAGFDMDSVVLTLSGIYIPGNGKALVKLQGSQNNYLVAASQNKGNLKLFKLNHPAKLLKINPDDISAVKTFKNGLIQKEEFYYGASFLSQSGRFITVDKNIISIRVTNRKGNVRDVMLPIQ